MVIYVDMLILINFVADYFLLKSTAAILKVFVPFWRMSLSALLASAVSLYIFLPEINLLLSLFIRIFFCFIIVLCAFGYRSKKQFLKAALCFSGLTLAFAGVLYAAFEIFSPRGMHYNNTVAYFDISPLVFILSAAAFYIFVNIIDFFFSKKNSTKKCEITLFASANRKNMSALLDSGNSLSDPLSDSAVIIVNKSDVEVLFDKAEEKRRFCVLPCSSVTGESMLEGYRLDKAEVTVSGKKTVLTKPIAAFSKSPIEENTAILNPDFVE
ncbi:MAG: sigma-E processing peptidase SpoIIGA [Clostridia bacterium]|nr:sigma-E processing peptidase SpoIIGA [Clostridia bacterium]